MRSCVQADASAGAAVSIAGSDGGLSFMSAESRDSLVQEPYWVSVILLVNAVSIPCSELEPAKPAHKHFITV